MAELNVAPKRFDTVAEGTERTELPRETDLHPSGRPPVAHAEAEGGTEATAADAHDTLDTISTPPELSVNSENGSAAAAMANGIVPSKASHGYNAAAPNNGAAAARPKRGPGNAPHAARNTHVFLCDGDTHVRLHQTTIVIIRANGDVALSSGGWRSLQTIRSINTALKTYAPTIQVTTANLPPNHIPS